ncbi:MAG: hypothetical protein K2L51_01050 [Clostridiales bacterium]|nr:hypothetical protein [Clostridiales bacterium]
MTKTFIVVNRHFSVVLETSEDISLGGAEHRIMDGNTWIKQCQAFKEEEVQFAINIFGIDILRHTLTLEEIAEYTKNLDELKQEKRAAEEKLADYEAQIAELKKKAAGAGAEAISVGNKLTELRFKLWIED